MSTELDALTVDAPLQRRSRMRRSPSRRRIELTDRDIAILQLLGRYRFLRSTQIHAFVGGKSQKRFIERLGHLYHETGYLNRPDQQWQAFNARYLPVVYELSASGAALLSQQGLLTREEQGCFRTAARQYHHELMICDVLSALELALRAYPQLRLVTWQEILRSPKFPETTRQSPNPLAIPVSLTCTDPRTKKASVIDKPVIPDALLGIAYAAEGRTQYRFFALETDRGTEPLSRSGLEQSSYLRKLLQYREIVGRSLYRTWWGLPNLLVLNVTTSKLRLQNLMQVGCEHIAGSDCSYLLFKAIANAVIVGTDTFSQSILSGWQRIEHAPFDLSS